MKEIILVISLVITTTSFANNIEEYKENIESSQEISYQDPTGVQAYFNSDGSLKKILATGEAELLFGSRKDKRLALRKATMRAKAEISKFLNEKIKSSDTVDEIVKTISKANTKGESSTTRESIENQVETLEIKSKAILRGVVILQQSIDSKEKFVTVTVGMKTSTIQAAKDLQGKINSSSKDILPEISTISKHEKSNKVIRRSRAMDDF